MESRVEILGGSGGECNERKRKKEKRPKCLIGEGNGTVSWGGEEVL